MQIKIIQQIVLIVCIVLLSSAAYCDMNYSSDCKLYIADDGVYEFYYPFGEELFSVSTASSEISVYYGSTETGKQTSDKIVGIWLSLDGIIIRCFAKGLDKYTTYLECLNLKKLIGRAEDKGGSPNVDGHVFIEDLPSFDDMMHWRNKNCVNAKNINASMNIELYDYFDMRRLKGRHKRESFAKFIENSPDRYGENIRLMAKAILFEKDGRGDAAAQIYRNLSTQTKSKFPSLYLIRNNIENGIAKNYIEGLADIDAKSNLRRSLLSTMIDLSSQYNKDAPYCGEADALMLLSLGNRSEMNLAGSGSTYYKKAIQLKNNYVEAYLLYGRSLLNGNNSVGESIDKILNMLDKAPYSEEIKKLKAEIISWKDENLY